MLVCATWPEVVDAIRALAIRGAPAIGDRGGDGRRPRGRRRPTRADLDGMRAEIATAAAALRSARPTAVNLAWAVDAQERLAAAHPGPAAGAGRGPRGRGAGPPRRRGGALRGASAPTAPPLLAPGRARHDHLQRRRPRDRAATARRSGWCAPAYAADPTLRVVVPETRPLLQGARLTAWELARDGIPHTLITDSMAGAMMAAGARLARGGGRRPHRRQRRRGQQDRHLRPGRAGARARHPGHRRRAHLDARPLDARRARASPSRSARRRRCAAWPSSAAPPRRRTSPVANPAFDVTPARLVAAIVTENGRAPAALRALAAARARRPAAADPRGMTRDAAPARDAGQGAACAALRLLDLLLPPACAAAACPARPACDACLAPLEPLPRAVVRGLRRAGARPVGALPGLPRAASPARARRSPSPAPRRRSSRPSRTAAAATSPPVLADLIAAAVPPPPPGAALVPVPLGPAARPRARLQPEPADRPRARPSAGACPCADAWCATREGPAQRGVVGDGPRAPGGAGLRGPRARRRARAGRAGRRRPHHRRDAGRLRPGAARRRRPEVRRGRASPGSLRRPATARASPI